MKTLFNEFYAPTDEGNELSDEARSKVRGLFEAWVAESGFSPREVSAILHMIVGNCEAEYALNHAVRLLEQREGRA